jgi:putative transposase
MGGHRRPILEPHRDFIVARLKERPETTLIEMRDLLVAERGVRVALDTIWRHLARRAADV